MIEKCKAGGFNPFADEGVALVKRPSEMTEAELIARNQEVTKRFANKTAKSDDTAPIPTFEEEMSRHEDRKEKGYNEAINSVMKHTVKTWINELEEADTKKETSNV